MKKILLFALAMLFFNTSWAQDAPPEMFKFQALITKPDGKPVKNKMVGVKIAIRQSATDGTLVYRETFTPTTNNAGIINIEIGNGTPKYGVFSEIPWEAGEFFLKLRVDINGGTNYTNMGTSQLLSVPYALLAKKALSVEGDNDTDPTNELELPVEDGTDGQILTTDGEDTVSWQTIEKASLESLLIENNDGGDNQIKNITNPTEDQDVATKNYVDLLEVKLIALEERLTALEEDVSPIDNDQDGYTTQEGDCDDNNPDINPGHAEVCNNSIDDNCDGQVDEGCETVPQIGDVYQGGIVYYILQPGDNGYVEGQTHGLITTNNYLDISVPWWNVSLEYPPDVPGTSTEIGSGFSNTELIISAAGDNGFMYAAKLARDYNGGGFTDWFLPSKDEVNLLYLYNSEFGDIFSHSFFWTSSDRYNSNPNAINTEAWAQNISGNSSGQQLNIDKNEPYGVFAVRAFSLEENNCTEEPEICDGFDNDCDGEIDEGCNVDNDGDGFTIAQGDCHDGDNTVYPGAEDICDGIDNDCDGQTDEDVDIMSDPENCGACGESCPPGYSCVGGTCEPNTNPDDTDGDGFTVAQGDCDDDDDTVYPGATEIVGDGIDQDCDGIDPENDYGRTIANPGLTCRDILDNNPSTNEVDGTYFIDPDGIGGNDPFDCYCDMTTDGGGWTFFAHVNNNYLGSNLFDTDVGTYKSDRSDDDTTYGVGGTVLQAISHTEMMVTLDFIDVDDADLANKLVFYQYSDGHPAFNNGPIPCIGLTGYAYRFSKTGPFSAGGTTNKCDDTGWYSRTAGNNNYLVLFISSEMNGNYWGSGMGGNNSWYHDGWWYVR